MQRHHHRQHDPRYMHRDDRGRFEASRDNWRREPDYYNDDTTSAYGDDRSGYRSNDNARYGGGYQAGASSGEGASYGGRDWYNGGAGDNRYWADRYERGERGYSSYGDDRHYNGPRDDDGRQIRAYDDRGAYDRGPRDRWLYDRGPYDPGRDERYARGPYDRSYDAPPVRRSPYDPRDYDPASQAGRDWRPRGPRR